MSFVEKINQAPIEPPTYFTPPPAWDTFFSMFKEKPSEKEKAQMVDYFVKDVSRMIDHHLKRMKEHFRKLKQDQA